MFVMRPRKVCLLGVSFDTGNMGVSALAASLVKLVSIARPDAEISFFVGAKGPKMQPVRLGDREIETRVVNYRMSPRSPLREHILWLLAMALVCRIFRKSSFRAWIIESHPALKVLSEASLVGDIRGGDSFSDIYGLRSLLMGSLPAAIGLLLGKKLVMLPQTYGPYSSAIGKRIARFILARSVLALSRDREGLQVVEPSIRQGLSCVKNFATHITFRLFLI
jgi:colanic acid/amylovoran biosynthesis protein